MAKHRGLCLNKDRIIIYVPCTARIACRVKFAKACNLDAVIVMRHKKMTLQGYIERSVTSSLFVHSNRLDLVEVIQWLEGCIFAEQDPSLDEVGEEDFSLIRHML